jgi:predicted membrane protein
MNEKGLYPLPLPIKVFIISYLVLISAGLLLAFWVVLESPVLKGETIESQYPPEALQDLKAAEFYENLKKAHVHHLGHVFMVFSIAGIYAFTREKSNIKIQIIVWTVITTLIHTLAFLIYSRILLIVFGSIYAGLMVYMMIIILIDLYKPIRELIPTSSGA